MSTLTMEFSAFSKNLRNVFRIYDEDNSGFLDKKECRELIDDLRISLYLPKADGEIFARIFDIIDVDKDGEISLNEINEQLHEIYPILQEVGNELKDQLTCEFDEFDFDDTGKLGRFQIEMLFNRISERLNLGIFESWQIDYLISLIDENSDGDLDVNEVISNYRTIVKEMYKFHNDNKKGSKNLMNPYDEKNPLKKDKCHRQKSRLFKTIGTDLSAAMAHKKTNDYIPQQSKKSIIDLINFEAKSNANHFRAVTDLINPETNKIQSFKNNEMNSPMVKKSISSRRDSMFRQQTTVENLTTEYKNVDINSKVSQYDSRSISVVEDSISVDELETEKKMKAFKSISQNFPKVVINKDKGGSIPKSPKNRLQIEIWNEKGGSSPKSPKNRSKVEIWNEKGATSPKSPQMKLFRQMTKLPTLKEEDNEINTPKGSSKSLLCSKSGSIKSKKGGKSEEMKSISSQKIDNKALMRQPNRKISSDHSDFLIESEKKAKSNKPSNTLWLPQTENEILIQELLNKLRPSDKSINHAVDKKNEQNNLLLNIVSKLKLDNDLLGKEKNLGLENTLVSIANLVKNSQNQQDAENMENPVIKLVYPSGTLNEIKKTNFIHPSWKKITHKATDKSNNPSYKKIGDKKDFYNTFTNSFTKDSAINRLKYDEVKNNSSKPAKVA